MPHNTLIKWVSIFFIMTLSTISWAQSSDSTAVQKMESKILGIWKLDLNDQKNNLEPAGRSKLNQLDESGKDLFWMKSESRVYVLESDKKVLVSWVDDGSFYEQRGSWNFNPESGILELLFDKESQGYRVTFTGNGMVWIPNKQVDEMEILSVLYLRSLGK